jgi:hypothetical protein
VEGVALAVTELLSFSTEREHGELEVLNAGANVRHQ